MQLLFTFNKIKFIMYLIRIIDTLVPAYVSFVYWTNEIFDLYLHITLRFWHNAINL